MTLRPKMPADLALAPVAAEIDLNLQRLRSLPTMAAVFEQLAVELNIGQPGPTREEREHQILLVALRDVDLHGWLAEVSDDASRVHLHGGSVSLDIGLSPTLQQFIAG
jgi:hypothetical protein